jgi:hypothetical protein
VSRSAAVLLVLALLAVTALAACGSDDPGGSSTAETTAAASAQTSSQTTPPPAATSTETVPAATTPENNAAALAKCHAALDGYVTRLRAIKTTVDGTPTFKTYDSAVKDMVDDYSNNFTADKIPSPSCAKSVAKPVTGAYVKYYVAAQRWTDCRKRQRCAAVMAQLKKQWKEAGTYLAAVDKGFSSVTAR